MLNKPALENNPDYYWENGLMVFTRDYHLKRGYCCKNGCRHCPYGFRNDGMKKKVTISWSGGKDSAFALYKILSLQEFDVVNLHTVIDEQTKRVGLHGVSEELIEKQAQAIGLPLKKIYLPASDDHQVYTNVMDNFYHYCVQKGIDGVVFGDIFLEDLKTFRINLLKPTRLFASFPLWGMDSSIIVNDFIQAGFKSTICAADANLLSKQDVGKIIDRSFLTSLSAGVDPCGENGEFHSFVFDGPIFQHPIPVLIGDVVKKTYLYQKKNLNGEIESLESSFWFQDLLV